MARRRDSVEERLASLRAEEAELRNAVRTAELEEQRVHAEVEAAREARVEATASGTDTAAAQGRFERAQADAAKPLVEVREGLERRVARKAGEVAAFVAENVEALVAERRPKAEANRDRLLAALAEVRAARAEWDSLVGAWDADLRLSGPPPRQVMPTEPPAQGVIAELRRLDTGEIPLAMPALHPSNAEIVRAA